MTKRTDFLAVLETILRATSLVTTPVCGDGMTTKASEPLILGFSTFLQVGQGWGETYPSHFLAHSAL